MSRIRGLAGVLPVVVAVIVLAGTLAMVPASAAVGATTGDGRIDISELSRARTFTLPAAGTSPPTSTYFRTTDTTGKPWFTATPTATCTLAAGPGLFAQLNDGSGKLACGTNSPIAQEDYVVASGAIILPPGTQSLVVRSSNAPVAGATRAAWFGLWSAESPDMADIVERGSYTTAYQVPASVDVPVPVPQECANPNALAFRIYVADDGNLFGYDLQWSIDGAPFTEIPVSNISTVGGVSYADDNSDGTDDYLQVDTDGDGVADWVEMDRSLAGSTIDTDGDGVADCLDPDSDGDGNGDTADPNRTIPVALDDTLSMVAGTGASLTVGANDEFRGASLVFTDLGTGTADPARYTLAGDGTLTYNSTVDDDALGPFTVNYRVCNTGTSPPVCAEAAVNIIATDDANPVPVDDSGATPDDLTSTTVGWQSNDNLVDWGNLTGVESNSVGGGTVMDNGDGTFTYIPAPGFHGTDTFDYEVCDADYPTPSCATATVSVFVGAAPRLGLAKAVTTPLADNGDGTFSVTYAVTAENLGNEALDGVTLDDDLSGIGDLVSASLTSTDVTVNPAYDGTTDTSLASPFTLAVGASVTVTVELTVLPSGPGDVANQVTGRGTGAVSGLPATDLSDAGTDPDPDGDHVANEDGENDTTMFNLLTDVPWAPALEVTKTLTGTTSVGAGVFDATFTVTLANTGNEPLTAPALSDDLSGFPGFVSGSLDSLSGATANPGFDGTSDTALLAPGSQLAAGRTVTATVTVRFAPTGPGVTTNTAVGAATSAWTGAAMSARGEASLDSADLPITTDARVTKDLVGVVDGSTPGSFVATYQVTVDNPGTESVTVDLTDDLRVFPPGSQARVTEATGALTGNPDFDGVTDRVLDATDTVPAGSSGTITYTVEWTPTSSAPITNRVEAAMTGAVTGTAANGSATTDLTTADIPYATSLGSAKRLVSVSDLGGGNFRARYEFTVRNYGTEPVSSVQLVDDLSGLPAPSAALVSATGLTFNPAFDGLADPNLLTGGDTVAVGGTAGLVIDVTLTPDSGATLSNAAVVTGAGTFSGAVTTDASDDGGVPDSDGDGNPSGPDEADRTPTWPPFLARTGVAKNLDGVAANPDGSFTATYTVAIENFGNEPIVGVQVTDQLSAFPAGSTVAQVSAVGVTPNPRFDGVTDTGVLAGTDRLDIGATASVTFSVRFSPTDLNPIENRAAVWSTGAYSGVVASDSSVDGTDPDPDGDGSPVESSASVIDTAGLGITPALGVAKRLVGVTEAGDGHFVVTYEVTVENMGNELLVNVSVTDDLASRVPAGFVATTVAGGTLAANPDFDGVTDTRLLAAGVNLAVGNSGTVRFQVDLKPTGPLPIDNNADAAATGRATGLPVTDVSTDGTDPDPDGNGTPDEAAATRLGADDLGLGPVLGLAKALTSVVDADGGAFTVTYTFTVQNLGNEIVTQVQITDDLSAFPPTATVAVGGDLTPSAGYDGRTRPELLAGTDTLDVGATATVVLQVTFVPTAGFAGIDNQARVSGRGVASGYATWDDSVSGSAPDPDGNGTPGEAGVTTLTLADLPLAPAVGAAKALEGVTDTGGGVFTASYLVVVRNVGNTPVTGVQATDDISGTFPTGSTATVEIVAGAGAANPAFDGITDVNLFGQPVPLDIGVEVTVRVRISFVPVSTAPIGNTITVTGTDTVGGTPLRDDSDEGTTPDADGNGDPSGPGENDPTRLAVADLPLAPVVGSAKRLDGVEDNGDGSFTAVYTLTVENLGNETLAGVQVTDRITGFPTGSTATVRATDALTANPTFDGLTDAATLAGTDELAVGETGTITVAVVFTLTSLAPIDNVAAVTGTGVASGATVEDVSTDGPVSDPDGNGRPDESLSTTLTRGDVPWDTSVGGAKEVVGTTDHPDGSFTVTYRITVANTGNETLVNVQVGDWLATNFPSGYTATVTSDDLTPNDGYDGYTDAALLAGQDTLAVGETGVIDLQITFTPVGPVDIGNQVEVTADGAVTGTPTSDRSADGHEVDPNGDGSPIEASVSHLPTTNLAFHTSVGLAKAVEGSGVNADGTFWVT
ncbi:MAG: beta strand repeat-containing protein, partial [Acidimicrobiales bacterium]